jgi:hypothetical protein
LRTASAGSEAAVCLLYSARTLADVIYWPELDSYGDGDRIVVSYTLTRAQRPGGPDTRAG